MKKFLQNLTNRFWEPRAMVLMYHRVAEPETDIWDIAVSPENFEKQLKVLKSRGNVMPLKELTARVKNKTLKKNSIAITFDDGYADNFLVAKPLLEKYALPATFFIASAYVSQEKEFWWDELENLILFTKQLPPKIAIPDAKNGTEFSLKSEAHLNKRQLKINRQWKASEQDPPSLRCELFMLLWQQLREMPLAAQQQQLQFLRDWANCENENRETHKPMSVKQLQELAQQKLFDIGAHTVSHPALAFHDLEYQQMEFLRNKDFLQKITGQEINLLAYPYGNYNTDSTLAAATAAFHAAFTTEEKVITKQSPAYQMGRFQVKNLPPEAFKNALKRWNQT